MRTSLEFKFEKELANNHFNVEVGSLWDYDRSLCNSSYTNRLKVERLEKTKNTTLVYFKQKMPYLAYDISYFDGKTFKPHVKLGNGGWECLECGDEIQRARDWRDEYCNNCGAEIDWEKVIREQKED